MSRLLRRSVRGLGLGLYFLWELVLSSLQVSRAVVGPLRQLRPGILALPLDVEGDGRITLLASLISLTPGTLSLDVADDRRTLFVHAMLITDPEAERLALKRGMERKVMEATT